MNPQTLADKHTPVVTKEMESRSQHFSLVAGFAGSALLLLMIAFSPAKLLYNEPFQIGLAKSVQVSGWRAALTASDNHSACGPLYPAIHLAVSPLTGLQAPAIRFVNLFCLTLVVIALATSARAGSLMTRWLGGFSILAVPFLWPTVGMALTEIPPLATFSFFVLAMHQILKLSDRKVCIIDFAWAAIAGLSLGMSILGRQTYLVVLPAVAALFFVEPKNGRFGSFASPLPASPAAGYSFSGTA